MDNSIKVIADEVLMLKNKLAVAEENLRIHTNRMKKLNLIKNMLDRHHIESIVVDYDIIISMCDINVMREQYEAKIIISFAATDDKNTINPILFFVLENNISH